MQGANTNSTTTLVSSIKNGNDTLAYTYDELGNITSVSENGTVIESYTYDDLNQLKTVTRGNDVYTYTYDNGGNILSVTKNGTTTKTYTYGNSQWKDLLTAYNGNAIIYDNIGNPLSYYDGSTFTWSDGRKLTGITKGTDNISYTYDSNGLRASKNVNGTVTEYYWLDGTLYAEKTGNRYIYFHYDDNGIAYGFTVNDGTTTTDYYYIHNLQGDVIGIVDNNGIKVVEYTYDEWGKLLATTGTLATTIGTINPFRYRGYYYDTETGFYYCQSRYYDPEISRWINADSYISTGQGMLGYNMFAYCENNPTKYIDIIGNVPDDILLENARKYAAGGNVLMCGYANNRKDITEKLNEVMKENAALLSQYSDNHSYIETVSYFVDKVKPGGDWDFKSQDDWNLNPFTKYEYNDIELRYDDIGNIHYGYVGRVIFSTSTLLMAGGLVQIYDGTSKWYFWASNFDDPRDQWAISIGCNLWDKGAVS